ncbi:Iron-uptake system permease protein FeuB [compost metagenome]
MQHKRWAAACWFLLAAAVLLLSIGFAASYGAKELSLRTVWTAVFAYDDRLTSHQIIHDLRLPRVLGAALSGMAFGAAGAIMQAVTRNPLADSGVLGINAGAAMAVALSFAFWPGLPYIQLMMLSFLGAALSTLAITGLASLTPGGLTSLRLTIAGAVISAMLHSVTAGIAIYYALNQDLAFWYAGGVAGIGWSQLRLLAPVIVPALLLTLLMSRSITLMSLGEESAAGLGIRTGRVRLLGMGAAVILAGAAVSAAGSIAFVGLVVPHIARRLVGVTFAKMLPLSALLGAILLVLADLAARTVNPPREFAIGAMVAIIGVPFFLYLARKEGREL